MQGNEEELKGILVQQYKVSFDRAKAAFEKLGFSEADELDVDLLYEFGEQHGRSEALLEMISIMYGEEFSIKLWLEASNWGTEWNVKL